MKKVLFVIAPSDFRDEELFETKKALEKVGVVDSELASTKKGEAVGMLGRRTNVDLLVSQVKLANYSAVVFVGGKGVESHRLAENPDVLKLAREAYASGKVVGAICIAPRILASAGIVNGKKVTSFPDSKTKELLKNAGSYYTGASVERDGKIITADGPNSATIFGEKIAQALS
ncbi:MAG: DJ-1/PfpI family protein [Candidatus Anstonellales archaeon]